MKALWIIYPFCSIFMIVGAGIAFYAIRGIMKAKAIDEWPTVNVHLTKCEFKTHSDSDGDSYEVIVQYDYTVVGKEYSSNKIHPSYSASSFDGHRPLYEKLKKCSVVRARYNELAPEESYIVTGRFTSALSILFGGILFFSAGLFFLLIFHFAIVGNSNYAGGLDVVQ
jgi:hypothetical protein